MLQLARVDDFLFGQRNIFHIDIAFHDTNLQWLVPLERLVTKLLYEFAAAVICSVDLGNAPFS